MLNEKGKSGMKNIGIIAEYNPFHNGHAYQIEKIRNETKADHIVIAMSGDFVQRGAPAVINKYARTRMALSCGADLVLELPALWACASAERFAAAGCLLFDKTGCVDGLCFGTEADDITLLSEAAELLSDEPERFSKYLTKAMKKGLSYPAAREAALQKSLSDQSFGAGEKESSAKAKNPDIRCSGLPEHTLNELLGSPNNILAIEYLKAIRKLRLPLTPFPLKRNGADYHNGDICAKNASATAIRALLTNTDSDFFTAERMNLPTTEKTAGCTIQTLAATDLERVMPPAAVSVLREYLSESPLLREDDFSSVLGYLLHLYAADPKGPENPLSRFGDSNTTIANRIIKHRYQFETFSQFCELCKSRNITYTRISRILLHTLLNITNDDYKNGEALDCIPYLRILGFRKKSAPLLTELKRTAKVPIISKPADASRILGKEALRMFERDVFAAELYERTRFEKRSRIPSHPCAMRSEYAMGIVMV